MRMSQDGLFFKPFGRIHPKYQVPMSDVACGLLNVVAVASCLQTPVFGTVFTGILSSIIAFFLDIEVLADMISIGTLLGRRIRCNCATDVRDSFQHGVRRCVGPAVQNEPGEGVSGCVVLRACLRVPEGMGEGKGRCKGMRGCEVCMGVRGCRKHMPRLLLTRRRSQLVDCT